ncbi:MAG: hypothetical protein FH762_01230 [Firmicutes bacterium]|nr:hypothetical protein [Bacillota bacterium]
MMYEWKVHFDGKVNFAIDYGLDLATNDWGEVEGCDASEGTIKKHLDGYGKIVGLNALLV